MKIEERIIKSVIAYDRNPRLNDSAIGRVLESLKKHGQVKPIVLSAKGKPFEQEIICAGHTTIKALEKFGAKNVFCVVKEFETEKEFIDYNIRDNKSGEFAEWDEKTLAELNLEFDLDLDEMGFDFGQDDEDLFEDEDKEKEESFKLNVTLDSDEDLKTLKEELLSRGFLC